MACMLVSPSFDCAPNPRANPDWLDPDLFSAVEQEQGEKTEQNSEQRAENGEPK
jgi:hypothetical protein